MDITKFRNLSIEEIREIGKKDIGYTRHETLLGKDAANNVLFHWMIGFEKAQSLMQENLKIWKTFSDENMKCLRELREKDDLMLRFDDGTVIDHKSEYPMAIVIAFAPKSKLTTIQNGDQ